MRPQTGGEERRRTGPAAGQGSAAQATRVLARDADMKKSADTAGVPGEHFGWLGNILDQNLRCFVAFGTLNLCLGNTKALFSCLEWWSGQCRQYTQIYDAKTYYAWTA